MTPPPIKLVKIQINHSLLHIEPYEKKGSRIRRTHGMHRDKSVLPPQEEEEEEKRETQRCFEYRAATRASQA